MTTRGPAAVPHRLPHGRPPGSASPVGHGERRPGERSGFRDRVARTVEVSGMLVVRFKMQCQPGKTEQVMAALEEVIAPSRALEGVVTFDVARDLADPDSFIATEVFEDRAAMERQESLPEVGRALAILEKSLVAEPEATVYEVASSAPWGA